MGIQGFSKPQSAMVIFAADAQHEGWHVRNYLSSRGVKFTPMLGSYRMADGIVVQEVSYFVSLHDYNVHCHQFAVGQESVLFLDHKDSRNRFAAQLMFNHKSGKPAQDLGRMFSVPLIEAVEGQWGDAWSIPLDGKRDGSLVAFVCAQVDKYGEPIKPASVKSEGMGAAAMYESQGLRTKGDLGKVVNQVHKA